MFGIFPNNNSLTRFGKSSSYQENTRNSIFFTYKLNTLDNRQSISKFDLCMCYLCVGLLIVYQV